MRHWLGRITTTWLATALMCGVAAASFARAGAGQAVAGSIATPAAPAAAPAARPMPSPVPLGKPGHEKAAAKALISKLEHMKSIGELPPLLTNDSAAMMGVMFGAMLYMVAGFAEGFGTAAQGMASGMGGPSDKQPKLDAAADADMKRLKAIKTDLDATFQRYGLNLQQSSGPPLPQQLRSHGRAFLRDMLVLLDKLPSKAGEHGNGFSMHSTRGAPSDMPDLSKAKYRVVSRTRVKISGVDKHGKAQQIEARVEDGGWRLHLGDFSKLTGGAAAPAKPGAAGPAH